MEVFGGYDTASVRLFNVISTVTVGDVVCNLKHIRLGTYIALKPNGDTLFCEAKKTYTLQATWNGHTISAQTTAPESTLITIKPAQIDSTASRPQENYVNLRITLPIQFDLQYNQIQTNTLYIKTQETKESQYIIQETDSLYNAWEFYSYFPIYRITNKPTETKDGMFNVIIEGYFGKHSATVFQYYTQAYVETIIYDKQYLDYINTE